MNRYRITIVNSQGEMAQAVVFATCEQQAQATTVGVDERVVGVESEHPQTFLALAWKGTE